MKKFFALAVSLLLGLSLLAGPAAQAYDDDELPPPPPVEEHDPDDGVMPAEYPARGEQN